MVYSYIEMKSSYIVIVCIINLGSLPTWYIGYTFPFVGPSIDSMYVNYELCNTFQMFIVLITCVPQM